MFNIPRGKVWQYIINKIEQPWLQKKKQHWTFLTLKTLGSKPRIQVSRVHPTFYFTVTVHHLSTPCAIPLPLCLSVHPCHQVPLVRVFPVIWTHFISLHHWIRMWSKMFYFKGLNLNLPAYRQRLGCLHYPADTQKKKIPSVFEFHKLIFKKKMRLLNW